MLLGEYEHTIDDKNRVTLPAKFRQSFDGGCVVTRGLDGCIYVWTPGSFDHYRDSQLATLHPLSQQGEAEPPALSSTRTPSRATWTSRDA